MSETRGSRPAGDPSALSPAVPPPAATQPLNARGQEAAQAALDSAQQVSSNAPIPGASPRYNRVFINVPRGEIASVRIVDTDFVFVLKSGIRVLIRDGALRAAAEPDYGIVFAGEEAVEGQALIGIADSSQGLVVNREPWVETDIRPREETPTSVVEQREIKPEAESTFLGGAVVAWYQSLWAVGGSAAAGVAGLAMAGKKVVAAVSTVTSGTDLLISAFAGPFIVPVVVEVYDVDGVLIAITVSQENGSHKFTLPADLATAC